MFPLACAAVTCWMYVLITMPRTPLPDNTVQELVYSRLLGRRQRLLFLALAMTGALSIAVLANTPQRVDPDLRDQRSAARLCDYPPVGFPTCYRLQIDRTWAREELQDGQWIVVGTVLSRPSVFNPYDDPATRNR